MTNSFPFSTWRLLITPPTAGAWNMAVDEAILESTGGGDSPTTLRLYAWQPTCLSLGYAQPAADADHTRLAANGWDLVRRPTGGRAILHTDELTYAVIGPQSEPRLDGSVLQSYQHISQALLQALRLLGVPAETHPLSPQSENNISKGPVCFEVPSNYEITVQGKKLIGSAQARRRDGVLQHGTLPLCGDLTRITQALCFDDEDKRQRAAARLLERATTVEKVMGYAISWENAAQAFVQAFEQVLVLNLKPGELSAKEQQRAEALVQTKFGNREWTERIKDER